MIGFWVDLHDIIKPQFVLKYNIKLDYVVIFFCLKLLWRNGIINTEETQWILSRLKAVFDHVEPWAFHYMNSFSHFHFMHLHGSWHCEKSTLKTFLKKKIQHCSQINSIYPWFSIIKKKENIMNIYTIFKKRKKNVSNSLFLFEWDITVW